jgi:transcriptional regulator with XRE-family HTH domain
MDPLRLRLGQTVRELRSAAGYSQESFAAKVKVHRTYMGSIERGKTNVSLETLERIARGLGMSVWELVRSAEVMAPGARDRARRAGIYDRRAKGDRDIPAIRRIAEDRGRDR